MLEILKEEKTFAQIASEYGGHPNSPNKGIPVDYLNRLKEARGIQTIMNYDLREALNDTAGNLA